MYIKVKQRIQLLLLPPGRRAHCQQRMLRTAREIQDEPLVDMLTGNIGHDRQTRLKQKQRSVASNKRSERSTRLRGLDLTLDRTLGGMHAQLYGLSNALGDLDPGPLAASLLETCFPQGLGAITRATFVDEHAAVLALLAQLDQGPGPEGAANWHAAIETLHIGPTVGKIRELAVAYGEELVADERHQAETPSADDIRQADQEGHERLCRVVAFILLKYGRSEPEADDRRHIADTLLAPLEEQEAAMRSLRRRRNPAVDVDPDTGDADEDSETPAESEV